MHKQADVAVKNKNIEDFKILSLISMEALILLKRGEVKFLDETRNYYKGKWERVELDKAQFRHLVLPEVLEPMSIEVISALSNSSDHLHYHEKSYALLTILGESEGYPEPRNCQMFFKSTTPVRAFSGITLQVEPGVIHSFSNGETALSFLSVQSHKIDDDYQFVTGKLAVRTE